MKDKKRPKLPRGLRWHSESQFIWFTWYDAQGKQHKKSTETTEPTKALHFKLRFLEEQGTRKADQVESPDLTKEPLEQVAKLYFEWKLANNAPETVARERRMFKNVLKFFGPQTPVKYIRLPQIRQYQKERRKQVSPTMKQAVTGRTVNYEIQLLKGAMSYADCWDDNLAARYQPLREVKSRAGKTATTEQLIKMIDTAMKNDYWQVAIWCAAVAVGSGCRGGEVRKLQLRDICLLEGKIRVMAQLGRAGTRDPGGPGTAEKSGLRPQRVPVFRTQGAEAGVPLEAQPKRARSVRIAGRIGSAPLPTATPPTEAKVEREGAIGTPKCLSFPSEAANPWQISRKLWARPN
jgi:hypothetical protein